MKIVSFNINGIRARLHQLAALKQIYDPDIIGLQEIKVHTDQYPHQDVGEVCGLHSSVYGQKAHHGVATLTRSPVAYHCGFPDDADDAQRRLLITKHPLLNGQTLTVINGYFPQGESRHHEIKWPAKQAFYRDLLNWLKSHATPEDPLVVLGDFNVAPLDQDIGIGAHNAKRWLRTGKSAFLPEEREWFDRLAAWGLVNSYRHCFPHRSDQFTWFDYRSKGFDDEPKRGLLIDHILITRPLIQYIATVDILYNIRAMEKPSDHAPVCLELTLPLSV